MVGYGMMDENMAGYSAIDPSFGVERGYRRSRARVGDPLYSGRAFAGNAYANSPTGSSGSGSSTNDPAPAPTHTVAEVDYISGQVVLYEVPVATEEPTTISLGVVVTP